LKGVDGSVLFDIVASRRCWRISGTLRDCDARFACISILVEYRRSAPSVAVTLGCREVFQYLRHAPAFSVRGRVARERLLHRSAHVLDGHLMIPSVRSSVSAPDAVP